MYIVLAILIFGLLIIVHELGHFLAAKAVGVRVNQFSLGLGPRLFGKQIGETDFCVCALPIGGACVMEGEDEASSDGRAFVNKPIWARFIILVAGSAMNFLMGVVILVIIVLNLPGTTSNTVAGFPEVLGETNGGLLAGDEIIKIDGERVIDPGRIAYLLSRSGENVHEIVVRRDGEKVTLENCEIIPRDFGDGAGLRYGINLAPGGDGLGDRLSYAAKLTAENVRIIRMSLGDLLTGAVGFKEMSGPVGITAVMSTAAKVSIGSFFNLAAFIAINLGVMNLLPLPALDGGRVLFLAVELILSPFGKKLDPKYENYVHLAGLVLFMALMVFVTFNDIVRLIKG